MPYLNRHGFSKKQSKELVDMIINNKDYHHSFSNTEHSFPVSPLFLANARSTKNNLLTKLKSLNIHNIVMLDVTTSDVIFKTVGCDGTVYDFAVPRQTNRKIIIYNAIENIISHYKSLGILL